MVEEIIITVFATVFAIFLVVIIFKNKIIGYFVSLSEKISEDSFQKLEDRNREILRHERELSEEKMRRNEQVLENKKDIIKELVDKIYGEIGKSNLRLESVEKERVGEFSNLKTLLEEHKEISKDLKNSTEDLKKILSNNQSRGKYGEEVAENILKMLGLQRDLDYLVNVRQKENANRPDLTIKLPDGGKVNVDVKFPYQALVRYQEAENKEDKKKFLSDFSKDVKEKIKQVTSREYINPEENTLDFVILFVPNEMVFSVICDQLGGISEEAMKKKVVIAGPFSFAAIIRMIRQSYENFRIHEDLHRLVGLIGKFKEEFTVYNSELDRLGDRIKSMSLQYDKVSTTRSNKLSRIVDKIDSEGQQHELLEKSNN